MPRRVNVTTLDASSIKIINTIRQNASYEYQQSVPVITNANMIPKVGEIIYGNGVLTNQFLSALMNRIARVVIQSATFNNPYSRLKKGYLETGETIEDIFISIANVVEFDAEKGEAREFKRNIPDVRSAFYTMNWRVQYPITIQDEDLRQAFTSIDGVTSFIAKIVDAMYTASEYDEFLLFKYLLVKAIAHGKTTPISVGDGTDLHNDASKYRGLSNKLTFISPKYNESGVRTNTPKDRQAIFMDSEYNAQFDVNVLASAFNMDKADFMGRLHLIDDWTTFDNKRFEVIRANCDSIEEVTTEELQALANVRAVLVDENWFQIYDNLDKMTEQYCASGLYWNYFYHQWKTVAVSPFANIVTFVTDTASIAQPATVTVGITSKDTSAEATVFTLGVQDDNVSLADGNFAFTQTEDAVKKGIAVHPYGAVIFPTSATTTTLEMVYGGYKYTAATALTTDAKVGATIKFNKGAIVTMQLEDESKPVDDTVTPVVDTEEKPVVDSSDGTAENADESKASVKKL